ncbi:MAG: Methylthioribulose-1-phosphate dehydratase [Piccolia ochrophora]|nr:MAG: Methylthioribulose-1-phosphate dehydratase [Piccolia ochrophora]
MTESSVEELVHSDDPNHPVNLIPELCRKFYTLGWVTGTGGGLSIRDKSASPYHVLKASTNLLRSQRNVIFIAPSGVQKELLHRTHLFILDYTTRKYLRHAPNLKPSACTPLFLQAFDRGAGCCIHTHSHWAVLVTLLVEKDRSRDDPDRSRDDHCFEISSIEQIKGIPRGRGKEGYMEYADRLRVPIIKNTAREEDLTSSLSEAMDRYPDTYAVLVQRHGV